MKYMFASLILLVSSFSVGQELKKVSAEYSMILSRTATMEQTETACLEQARLKAIGDEFGYVVSETTISNVNDSNGKVNDQFSVLTNTNVKGEWIKDTAPAEIVWGCVGNDYQVTVKVLGEVRAIKKEGKTKLNFFSCSPYDVTAQKFIFKNNERLNCSLTSSQAGYVSIYYLDHTSNEAIRLLPSTSYNHLDGVEIQPDTPYILFNKAYTNQFKEMTSNSSDLILGLPEGKDQIIDEIVVIYSPEPFAKPILSKDKSTNALPSLKISEFEKWKTELISRNSEVVTTTIAITIAK
jgi:hypothetical protein